MLTYVVSKILIESDSHIRYHSSRDGDLLNNTPCPECNHHSSFCDSFDACTATKGISAWRNCIYDYSVVSWGTGWWNLANSKGHINKDAVTDAKSTTTMQNLLFHVQMLNEMFLGQLLQHTLKLIVVQPKLKALTKTCNRNVCGASQALLFINCGLIR